MPVIMKPLLILILTLATFGAYAQKMTIGTYNIRVYNTNDNKKGNGWDIRCPVIANLVRFHDFDIWGAQEVLYSQLNDLLAALPQYGYVGAGRDDGDTRGEASPIFYKKTRFDLLQSGHFWLSEQSEIPNVGWDAALPRICSWGQFRDKESDKVFWFFNLHFDHVGVVARAESAKLVLHRIAQMSGNLPVILTGDFNVDQRSPSYQLFAESGTLRDAYEACAIRYAYSGTFNNFDLQSVSDSRIDHIFVSKEFTVVRYGILTDIYFVESGIPRLPSDHFPVKVVVSLGDLLGQ